MTDKRQGRKDQVGPWQCMKWVLLVCCATSLWQVVQLNGPGGHLLRHDTHGSASSAALSNAFLGKVAALQNSKLQALAQALGRSVPAESPFAAPGDPPATTAAAFNGTGLSTNGEAGVTIDVAARAAQSRTCIKHTNPLSWSRDYCNCWRQD